MPESALSACLVEHVCTTAVTKTTNLLGGSCGIFTLSPFLPFSKPSVLLCDLSVPSVLLCVPLCSLLRRAHSLSLSLHLLHPRAQLPVPSKLSALGSHCSSVLLVINLPSIGLCTALHSALCPHRRHHRPSSSCFSWFVHWLLTPTRCIRNIHCFCALPGLGILLRIRSQHSLDISSCLIRHRLLTCLPCAHNALSLANQPIPPPS